MKTSPIEIKAVMYERYPESENPDLPPYHMEVRLETRIRLSAMISMEVLAENKHDHIEYAQQYLADKFRTLFRWDQDIHIERKTQSEADPGYRERREHLMRELDRVRKEIQEQAAAIAKSDEMEAAEFLGEPPDKGYSDIIPGGTLKEVEEETGIIEGKENVQEDVGGVFSKANEAFDSSVHNPTNSTNRK